MWGPALQNSMYTHVTYIHMHTWTYIFYTCGYSYTHMCLGVLKGMQPNIGKQASPNPKQKFSKRPHRGESLGVRSSLVTAAVLCVCACMSLVWRGGKGSSAVDVFLGCNYFLKVCSSNCLFKIELKVT